MLRNSEKASIQDKFARFVNPNRVASWQALGVDLVIGKRERYQLWDIDGHEVLDVHLNGGTFNLGHRHPALVQALSDALLSYDIGNHHFPSGLRANLAERLAVLSPGLQYSVFSSGGSEAIDVAIKASRWLTKRRKVASITHGYHGRTGLSGAAGDDSSARFFLSDDPEIFVKAPFGDLDAMEELLKNEDVACVLMETVPATYGFPIPEKHYLPNIKRLCEKYGSIYVADEVQTGLMRSGEFWGVECYDVQPDILVTSKGLSGGLYPISATLLSPACGGWLEIDGWAHLNTYGGAELGCTVALAALDIYSAESTKRNVQRSAAYLGSCLRQIQQRTPFLVEVRQLGLIIGLKFDHPKGGELMMKALFDRGIWAIFAGFDRSVIQFKPGLLLTDQECGAIMDRFEAALGDVVSALPAITAV